MPVSKDYSLSTTVRGVGLPERAAMAIEEIQRFLRDKSGMAGDNPDQFVTRKNVLAAWGAAVEGGGEIPAMPAAEQPDYTPPPAMEGLQALGGYASVFVKWTPNTDRRIGYAEIWRASVNDIGQAVLIGTSASMNYADETQTGNSYFYWGRYVNRWNNAVKGPFNAVAGTPAATAPNLDYLLGLLTGSQGNQPFYAVQTVTTIDGVTIQPGVYVKSLFALDAIVRTFRAGLAVIDSANIISLDASKITTTSFVAKMATIDTGSFQTIFANKAFIVDANIASVNAGKIRSGTIQVNQEITGGNWYASNGTQGWAITGGGYAAFRNVEVTGSISGSTISGSTVNGGEVNGTTINGGVVNAATVVASYLRNTDGSRVVDLTDGGTFVLYTPKAKIMGDGSTQFFNTIASGSYFTPGNQFIVPPGGAHDPNAGGSGGG